MKRQPWLWIGAASVGTWLLVRNRGGSIVLGLPVERRSPLVVTPRGYFGAKRAGPPAHAHQGIDIGAPPGSHVLAVGDGEIVRTDPGLGKIVRKLRLDVTATWALGHRSVDAVVYADLGTPLVQPGDRVRKGEAIALVSRAGFVHFAVKQVRPTAELFFDPREAGLSYRITTPNAA